MTRNAVTRDAKTGDAKTGEAVRIYVPGTSTLLQRLVDTGALPASETTPLLAFAVTSGLREYYEGDDDESLEYAALTEAARASLRLLEADESALRRRVVVAADVDPSLVTERDDLDRGVVQVSHDVKLTAVASAHVDDPEASDVVALAASKMLAAELGDDAAQDAVDDAEGFDLSWYATQEIGPLLDLA